MNGTGSGAGGMIPTIGVYRYTFRFEGGGGGGYLDGNTTLDQLFSLLASYHGARITSLCRHEDGASGWGGMVVVSEDSDGSNDKPGGPVT